MYPNVRAEMARQDITLAILSERTKIPVQRLSLKLNGKGDLTMKEAITIREALGVDISLDELYQRKE